MQTIVGDVRRLQQRNHPVNIPHLVKKIKGFPVKVKAFQNSATYQKLRGGVRNKKKSGRCREVAVNGGWTVVCTTAVNNSGHMLIKFTST